MAHSLSQFKTALGNGGARPNLFKLEIHKIQDLFDGESSVLIKATNLPASNVASIDVPFRGRTFKVAGDRTFDNWSITVINDYGFGIRTKLENWMQRIAQYDQASGLMAPASYMTNATVTQLKRNTGKDANGDDALEKDAVYLFKDIFPVNISAIDLSYDSSDTIEEFTVEFAVNYWQRGS